MSEQLILAVISIVIEIDLTDNQPSPVSFATLRADLYVSLLADKMFQSVLRCFTLFSLEILLTMPVHYSFAVNDPTVDSIPKFGISLFFETSHILVFMEIFQSERKQINEPATS